jgi:hypothetical protein
MKNWKILTIAFVSLVGTTSYAEPTYKIDDETFVVEEKGVRLHRNNSVSVKLRLKDAPKNAVGRTRLVLKFKPDSELDARHMAMQLSDPRAHVVIEHSAAKGLRRAKNEIRKAFSGDQYSETHSVNPRSVLISDGKNEPVTLSSLLATRSTPVVETAKKPVVGKIEKYAATSVHEANYAAWKNLYPRLVGPDRVKAAAQIRALEKRLDVSETFEVPRTVEAKLTADSAKDHVAGN